MKKMLSLLFTLTGILFSQSMISDSSAQLNSGIIYGANYAFGLTAPDGWVLDNESGVSQGLYAVFYPRGGSWGRSLAGMYANGLQKDSSGNETIEKIIAADTIHFRKNYPNVIFASSPNMNLSKSKQAKIVCFTYSNYEAVAYIDEVKTVSIIVLTARDEKSFNDAFSAFQQLVSSYCFLATDIKIEQHYLSI